MLGSIEPFHQVNTFITVRPDASRRGHLEVVVSATPSPTQPSVSDVTDGRLWAVKGSLPAHGRASFASRVWAMAITLDGMLARERWAQLTLDGGADA